MRKRILTAVAILFLFMSLGFAQTPTPTATPNAEALPDVSPSPSTTASPTKKMSENDMKTPSGTVWFISKEQRRFYVIPKFCSMIEGSRIILIDCESKFPIKSDTNPVKVEPNSGSQNSSNSGVGTRPTIGETKQQVTPTPTPAPLAEKVIEVVNPWEKEDIEVKTPTKKQGKNWSVELTFETGVDSSYDGMDVGDRFHSGWVANQNVNVEFSYKDKFYVGVYNWGQVPFTDLKAESGWENDIGFYAGKKFSNGFGLEGGAAKYIVKGGSINNYSFALSKDIPLQNGYSLGIGNETSFFTVSKGLGFRGGMVNKTSYNLSKELFNGGITPSITLAHSVDNNPFYGDKKLNVRGFVTAEVKLAFSDKYSWSFGASYYFGIYRQTDRPNKGFFFIKITFGNKYEF